MNKKISKIINSLVFTFFITYLFLTNFSYANILYDWDDPDAYRPAPVLFLHGFGPGSPQSWTTEASVDEILSQYYYMYYTGYNPTPTILPSTRYPYLEIIDFGSSLIDRNSSVDTYQTGDKYVQAGQRNPGDPGWSDKLNTAIETLRQYYLNKDSSEQKIILVAHSMGGLAARKYLKSYSSANQKVAKLIMIGTPNLGSASATMAVFYSRNRRLGWYNLPLGWVSSSSIILVDKSLETARSIDIDGDAVWDMDPTLTGSGFISELNNNYSEAVDHFAIVGKHWSDFKSGDGVVSLDSQLGKGVLLLKNQRTINAIHWVEPALAIVGDNPLLKFLDFTPPVVEITSPDPNTVEEFSDVTISVAGKIYKEYLPADTKLNIKVIRDSDGSVILDEDREYSVKPSDFWDPNNPDSPVAEFEESVNFTEVGIFRIRITAINPAEIPSEPKEVKVKINTQGPFIQPLRIDGVIFPYKTIHRRPLIEACITSYPYNIDWESVVLTLDGVTVVPQINPSQTYPVTYKPTIDLSYGQHTATVKVKDELGSWSETKTASFEIFKWQEHWDQAPIGPITVFFNSEGGQYHCSNYYNLSNSIAEITPSRSLRMAYLEESSTQGIKVYSEGIIEKKLEPNTYLTFNVSGSIGHKEQKTGIYLVFKGMVNNNYAAIVYVIESGGGFFAWDLPAQRYFINLGYGSHTRNIYNDFVQAFGIANVDSFMQGQVGFYIYSDNDTAESFWDDIILYQEN